MEKTPYEIFKDKQENDTITKGFAKLMMNDMLNINIKTIPHDEQRYETAGDWVTRKVHGKEKLDGILVSNLGNEDYEFAIAMHESFEAYLCLRKGITQQMVDDFDIAYESARKDGLIAQCGCKPNKDSEPGDDKHAPYREEHQFATHIEKKLIKKMGLNWDTYSNLVLEL